jgi:superfamily II DNA helicase RecQ
MFDFLARMKQSKQKDANLHAVAAVEKMVDYCTMPTCRRQFLLRFFGERNTDPKSVCQKTCDFCQNPEKVRKSVEAASCVNDFSYEVAPDKEWDGQWDKPHGDADEDSDNEMELQSRRSQGLSLFGDEAGDSASQEALQVKPAAKIGFTKASDILAKYEVSSNYNVFLIYCLCLLLNSIDIP